MTTPTADPAPTVGPLGPPRCDRVVVVGAGADDESAAAQILTAVGPTSVDRVTSLVGRLSFGALLGVLERSDLVVSNDSGPRHLAGVVGRRTVSVYWVGNLLTAGPLSRDGHRVLVSYPHAVPGVREEQTHQRCPHDPSFVEDVQVGAVLTKIRSVLSG